MPREKEMFKQYSYLVNLAETSSSVQDCEEFTKRCDDFLNKYYNKYCLDIIIALCKEKLRPNPDYNRKFLDAYSEIFIKYSNISESDRLCMIKECNQVYRTYPTEYCKELGLALIEEKLRLLKKNAA